MKLNINLNPGGVLGGLIVGLVVLFLQVVSAGGSRPVVLPMYLLIFVGGFLGNASWDGLGAVVEYFFPFVPDPEDLENARKESWLHPSRASERAELLKRMRESGIGGTKETQRRLLERDDA